VGDFDVFRQLRCCVKGGCKVKNILLVMIGLVIVFGISITGFCQALTENLQVTIRADKNVYKIYNGSVGVDVEVELKNMGNSELEIKHPGPLYYPSPLDFTVEPTGERVSWLLTIQNIIEPPHVILKSQEVIRVTERLGIPTKGAGNYKLSARYTMDKVNYITSNTILIKAIEEKTLEIVIKSNKKVYEQNEDILIDGAIRNVSGKEVFLHLAPSYSPEFEICSTDSTYRTVYSGGRALIIIGGKISYEKAYFKFTPYEEKYFRPRNLYGSPKWFYYNGSLPWPFASNGRLKPGRYTIRLVRFEYKHKAEDITFKIDSNSIVIEIMEKKK